VGYRIVRQDGAISALWIQHEKVEIQSVDAARGDNRLGM
jgi:hypothetical protein